MVTLAAAVVCFLLLVLAVFQIALALGAPLGRFAWGGQHRVLPTALRVGSLVSVVIYALIAVVVSARAGLMAPAASDATVRVAAWVVAAYFLVGIGVNLASRSRPERLVMAPLCVVLGALSTVVAIS